MQLVLTAKTLSLISRELPSFSASCQLFYGRRMDAAAGRDAITSTQEENWRAALTGGWCSEGEVDRKHGKIHLKLAEYEQKS